MFYFDNYWRQHACCNTQNNVVARYNRKQIDKKRIFNRPIRRVWHQWIRVRILLLFKNRYPNVLSVLQNYKYVYIEFIKNFTVWKWRGIFFFNIPKKRPHLTPKKKNNNPNFIVHIRVLELCRVKRFVFDGGGEERIHRNPSAIMNNDGCAVKISGKIFLDKSKLRSLVVVSTSLCLHVKKQNANKRHTLRFYSFL